MFNDELLDIVIEALANHETSLKDISSKQSELNSSNKDISDTYIASTKEFRDDLQKLLENSKADIKSTVGAIEIPIPANGIDGKDGIDGTNGKDGIAGKAGLDGKNGLDGENGVEGKSIVGPEGDRGQAGKDGKKGVGIHSIVRKDEDLIIKLTDKQEIKIDVGSADGSKGGFGPATNRAHFLSKTRDVHVDTATDGDVLTYKNGKWINKAVEPAPIAEITTKTIVDTSTVDMNNEFILVDCTNNNIELFLPDIVSEIKRFYIKRIDNTSNTLIVKSALTIDDAEQIEIFQYESIPLLATPTKYHIL